MTNQIYKQAKSSNNMISSSFTSKLFTLKLFTVMFLTLLLITIVSADLATVTYQYKVNTKIDIKNQCIFNGTFCSPSTVCSLVVYDPENNILINNLPMTYQGAYFNLTLPGNNYTIGKYKNDMTCTDGGNSGSQTFYIEVITGGNLALFIILALSSLILLVFGIWMQNEYIGFISSTLFILTGLFALIYGVGENLSNMYTNSLGYIALGLGILFMIVSAYSAIADGGGLFKKSGSFSDSLESDSWGISQPGM